MRRFTALLHLVNAHEVLRRGEMREFGNDDVIAFTKTLGKEAFTVLVNTRKTPTTFQLPQGSQGRVELGPCEVRIIPSK